MWQPDASGRWWRFVGKFALLGVTRTVAGQAPLVALKGKQHGDRYAGFKAIVELAAKVLRIVWGVWRSGTPFDPLRAGGLRRQPR